MVRYILCHLYVSGKIFWRLYYFKWLQNIRHAYSHLHYESETILFFVTCVPNWFIFTDTHVCVRRMHDVRMPGSVSCSTGLGTSVFVHGIAHFSNTLFWNIAVGVLVDGAVGIANFFVTWLLLCTWFVWWVISHVCDLRWRVAVFSDMKRSYVNGITDKPYYLLYTWHMMNFYDDVTGESRHLINIWWMMKCCDIVSQSLSRTTLKA